MTTEAFVLDYIVCPCCDNSNLWRRGTEFYCKECDYTLRITAARTVKTPENKIVAQKAPTVRVDPHPVKREEMPLIPPPMVPGSREQVVKDAVEDIVHRILSLPYDTALESAAQGCPKCKVALRRGHSRDYTHYCPKCGRTYCVSGETK